MEGRLVLPRLNTRANISFCVDTGADCTVILPNDGVRIGLDYASLTGDHESIGLGGVCQNFAEPAIIVFTDPGRYLYAYMINVAICAPDPDLMDLPSLLGRDVLNQWRMRYDATRNQLTFTVLSADAKVPIPKP